MYLNLRRCFGRKRQKYPNLNEEKFSLLGEKVFQSSNNLGAIYQLK